MGCVEGVQLWGEHTWVFNADLTTFADWKILGLSVWVLPPYPRHLFFMLSVVRLWQGWGTEEPNELTSAGFGKIFLVPIGQSRLLELADLERFFQAGRAR